MASIVQNMQAPARDELDQVLQRYEARLKKVVTRKQAAAVERSRFMEQFMARARGDYRQVVEEVVGRLGTAGHSASIMMSQERYQESLTLKFEPFQGADQQVVKRDCQIRIMPNEATMRVGFQVSTAHSMPHSGADESYTLEELTTERLRAVLVRGISLILDSTLPKEAFQ